MNPSQPGTDIAPDDAIALRKPHQRDTRNADLRVRWLGRVTFADALGIQEDLVTRKCSDPESDDTLLLLEHEPVYTIGRTPDQSSLRKVKELPHPLFSTNRGGQATYHGPGQLIGYPIIDLHKCGQDLHRYLRWVEAIVTETLAEVGIEAGTRPGLTGVWTEGRKIASIGVGVRRWITMHGFALNVAGDLAPFDQIVPCGIANVTMTSIERETGRQLSVLEVATRAGEIARRRIGDLRTGRTKRLF